MYIDVSYPGIVTHITVYTVPLYKTLAHNYVVPDDVLTNGVAKHWARTTDQISLYWFPAFKEVVVANWTIVDAETPGNAWTNDHVPPTYKNFNFLTGILKEIVFGLTSSTCALANSLGYKFLHILEYYLELALLIKIPDFVPIYTEDGIKAQNPAVGYYDLMFAPICYDEPQGFLGAACPWSSHENGVTFVDNETDILAIASLAFTEEEVPRNNPKYHF
ncbi:hypothetical protein Bhyg_11575 [Pseudolycoriella hygida]|uniref:Uncharacterized protein n=1 Tax=Pseudolycoriella hygida TaxID=35572 RepID=A0A9Q0RZQ3_9DIPT|nr:hypothetical protein Bhyg_11575 [Pseudolycoriella hygida]